MSHEIPTPREVPFALGDIYTLVNEILAVEDVELALLSCSDRLTRPYNLLEVATLWANVLYNPAFLAYLQAWCNESAPSMGFHRVWGESQLLLALSCVDHLQQTESFPMTPEMRLRLPSSFSAETNPLRRLALISLLIDKKVTASTTSSTTPPYLPYAELRPGYRKGHARYARLTTTIPIISGPSKKDQALIHQKTVDALVKEGEIELSVLLTLHPNLPKSCEYIIINPIRTVTFKRNQQQPLLIGSAPRCDVCVGAVDSDVAPQHIILTEKKEEKEEERESSIVLINVGYDQSVQGGLYRTGFETTLQDIPAGTQIDLAQVLLGTCLVIYLNAIPFLLFPMVTSPQ